MLNSEQSHLLSDVICGLSDWLGVNAHQQRPPADQTRSSTARAVAMTTARAVAMTTGTECLRLTLPPFWLTEINMRRAVLLFSLAGLFLSHTESKGKKISKRKFSTWDPRWRLFETFLMLLRGVFFRHNQPFGIFSSFQPPPPFWCGFEVSFYSVTVMDFIINIFIFLGHFRPTALQIVTIIHLSFLFLLQNFF